LLSAQRLKHALLNRLWRATPTRILRPVTTAHGLLSTRLIPPLYLHNVGVADFETVGDTYVRLFVSMCGLRSDDHIVDIGAGTGRIARPLTRLLTSGSYRGLDIVEESVQWCRLAYRRFPNFEFYHADIRNSVYNPRGRFSASDYRFPFPDKSVTFVILTSVFTHMLPDEIENYLQELVRVLAPNGRVFATFFLLNDASREGIQHGTSELSFRHRTARTWHERADYLEAAVAYDESDMTKMCEQAGLRLADLRYGRWCGRPDGFDWQDVVILRHDAMFSTAQNTFYQELGPLGAAGNDGEPDES
jgi:SAM-dependent methyltransferase